MKEMNGLFNLLVLKKKTHSQTKLHDTAILHETAELVYKGLCEQNSVLNKDLKTRCRVCLCIEDIFGYKTK